MPNNCGQQIINSLTSGVIAVDSDARVLMANRAATENLHIATDLLRPGARLHAIPVLAPMHEVFLGVKQSRQPVKRREVALDVPPAGTKQIGLSVSLLEGPEPFNGVIFLFVDMTERRELERSAVLNRQLAALGELTAGVVHELRNPVSVVSGMAELLIRKLDPGDDRRATAEAIFREAAHLERAISQFLGFARPFELAPAPCSPVEVVDRAVQLCDRRAKARSVSVEREFAPDLPEAVLDKQRIAQALANIINNAIDEVEPASGQVRIRVYPDGDEIVFDVSDNGPGIPAEEGENLFAPFLTKKEGGTGLGLTIVYRTISAHRGSVHYGNHPDGGAQFIVRLPKDLHRQLQVPEIEF